MTFTPQVCAFDRSAIDCRRFLLTCCTDRLFFEVHTAHISFRARFTQHAKINAYSSGLSTRPCLRAYFSPRSSPEEGLSPRQTEQDANVRVLSRVGWQFGAKCTHSLANTLSYKSDLRLFWINWDPQWFWIRGGCSLSIKRYASPIEKQLAYKYNK